MQIFPSRLQFSDTRPDYFENLQFASPYSLPPLKNREYQPNDQNNISFCATNSSKSGKISDILYDENTNLISLSNSNFYDHYSTIEDVYQPKKDVNEKIKNELREKNRIAVKKCRIKRDKLINDLENTNNSLKNQYILLYRKMQELNNDNKVLSSKLKFFQNYMSNFINCQPI